MANEFKVVWENHPDTPLSAENLSKFIDNYSEGTILLKDSDDFMVSTFGDDQLKIRANSKISLKIPHTSALFEFNDSFISHDSKHFPTYEEEISFRLENSNDNISRSIALEEGTINLVSNPSFENGLDSWETSSLNPNSTVLVIPNDESILGNYQLEINIDPLGNEALASQEVILEGNENPVSVSFYYKSDGELKLTLVGNPESIKSYWSPSAGTGLGQWLGSPFSISLPAVSKWTRVEVKNIITTPIIANPNIKIEIIFSSNDINSTSSIDQVQLETKMFCSSFTSSTRQVSHLHLNNKIIRSEEGLIDFNIMPKFWGDEEQYLFTLRTGEVGKDAIRLFFDAQSRKLIFSVYHSDFDIYYTATINYNIIEFGELLDNWTRIVCSWNATEGMKLYAGDKSIYNFNTFEPIDNNSIVEIQVGSREGSHHFNGLTDSLKINYFDKSDDKILSDMTNTSVPDFNLYKFFENSNNNLNLNSSFIDTGEDFLASTTYYVWLSVTSELQDYADIKISQSSIKPFGSEIFYSRVFGGFTTDSSINIIADSIWDIRSSEKKVIHAERLIVHGRDSSTNNIEFRSSPYGIENDAQFNVVSRFTNNLYGNNGSIDFLDINPAGHIDIDDIRIDGNTIGPHNDTSMILNSYTGNDIIINTTNLDVNSNLTGVISLDNVKIKNNKIYTEVASDLLIESDQVDKNIIIKTLIGTTQFDSSIELFNTKTITLGEDLNQKINLDSTKAIGTQTDSVYIRTSNHINFFKGGLHSDTKYDSGGGTLLASITDNEAPTPTVDVNSRFYAGRVFNAVYNDLAECWYKKYNESINYYEVVVQTIDGVVKSSKRAQKGTIGVVSDTYGYILGTEDFNENLSISKKVPVAISGRAKVRVATSKIDIGDELISFKDGFAIKANWFEKIFKRDRIIGRVDSFLETDLIIMKVV